MPVEKKIVHNVELCTARQSHDELVVKSRADPFYSLAASKTVMSGPRLVTPTPRARASCGENGYKAGRLLSPTILLISPDTREKRVSPFFVCRPIRWRVRQPSWPNYINLELVFARDLV